MSDRLSAPPIARPPRARAMAVSTEIDLKIWENHIKSQSLNEEMSQMTRSTHFSSFCYRSSAD